MSECKAEAQRGNASACVPPKDNAGGNGLCGIGHRVGGQAPHRQHLVVQQLYQLAYSTGERTTLTRTNRGSRPTRSRRARQSVWDSLHSVFLQEIRDDDVTAISGPLRIKVLSLRDCSGLTDAGIKHLAETFPGLSTIEINACPKVTDAGFRDLLTRLPDLRCVFPKHVHESLMLHCVIWQTWPD